MKVNLSNNEKEEALFLKAILTRCLKKDETAQNMLFQLFYGYSKSICLRYSSSQEDAKDILMKGFMKVFQNLEKYAFERPFKAWLRTILVNTAHTYYRDQKKFENEISLENQPEIENSESIINALSAEELLALIQKLTPAYRSVFVMYAVNGYTHHEISEILNINEGTSKSNYMKARLKLQGFIQKSNPDLFYQYSTSKTKSI
jgi:RNA polymerase sigma-70 factor, ECF subfamily